MSNQIRWDFWPTLLAAGTPNTRTFVRRGLDGLSTRAIAERLGTGPTSMYWHVPTMADLYELIVDAAIGEIPLTSEGRVNSWREVMRELALATLTVYLRHPWLALLGIQPGIGPAARRYGEYAIDAFASAGVAHEDAIQATAIINNYVFGFTLRHAAWRQLKDRSGISERWGDRIDEYVAHIDQTAPELAAAIQTRVNLTSRQNFELGLDCVLDGIAHRLVEAAA